MSLLFSLHRVGITAGSKLLDPEAVGGGMTLLVATAHRVALVSAVHV